MCRVTDDVLRLLRAGTATIDRLIRDNARLERLNAYLTENITAAQKAGTAAVNARRELAWEVDELLDSLEDEDVTLDTSVSIRVVREILGRK